MSLRRAVLGLGVILGGCTPAADPAAIAAVQVLTEGAPPPTCRLLGAIEGQDANRWVPGGPYYEVALMDLKRRAVLGGGNEIVVGKVSEPRDTDYLPAYIIQAKLFACPLAARPGAVAKAADPIPTASHAPPRICEPDCSPGYTCLRGTCVSACNPSCAGGERCGGDRICHASSAPGDASATP